MTGTSGVTATYTVTVTDGNGGSVQDTLDVTFLAPNNGPVFTLSPTLEDPSEPIIPGGSVAIQFRASDVDTGALEYYIDGTLVGSFIQNSTVDAFVTAGPGGVEQTVTVVAWDGISAATDTLTFTPQSSNDAPVIGSFVSVGSPFEVGDAIVLNGSSITDADGDAMSYTITYTLDGVPKETSILWLR